MARHLDYPNIPFHALLRRAAERWPEKTAIAFGKRRLTFREWDSAAAAFAAALHDLEVGKGDRVALLSPNCPEYEIAFFGATRLGAVPTPLNPSYKEREVRHQLADAGASVAVVHAALLPVLEAVRHDLPRLRQVIVIGSAPNGTLAFNDLLESHKGTEAGDADLGPNDLAALPYSSGTTGASKGVMLTQRNLVCNAHQFVDATATTETDLLMIFLPLYHIYGVSLMATAVTSGAGQVLMERFDLEEVVRLVGEEGVTELYVVPPIMLALAGAPGLTPKQFRSVRFVMSAAAPLAFDIARRVATRLHLTVIQAYGMTESSPLTHMVPPEGWSEVWESVGVPAADTDCRIVDLETGLSQLGPGEEGEVAVAGPQIMAGYWNAPEETALAIRDGWLYTGDVGMVDGEGRLSILDRKKEMIKYKAFSIAPAELEALLLEHPAVRDCAVVGAPDEEAGEVPHAYIVLHGEGGASPEELQEFVRRRVAGYKQIRAVRLIDAIPRTPSGKILRRVLKEQARATAG